MSSIRPEKSKDLAEEKRARILGAALEVFAEKGYHAAGIADIATRLGMGHGTFYRYFENKLDIFAALLDQITTEITDVVRHEPAEARSLEEYRGQLDRIVMRLFLVFASEPRRAKVVFYEAWSVDPSMRAKVLAMFEVFGDFTESYIRRGIELDYLRDTLDAPVVARLLNAMIFEGLRGCLLADDPVTTGMRYAKAGIDLMLHGMSRPEGASEDAGASRTK